MAPASAMHAIPIGQSAADAHGLPQIASPAIGPAVGAGVDALASTNGWMNVASDGSMRTSVPVVMHPGSPDDDTPTSCSLPANVANAGPPLSPWHVIPG